MTSPVLSSSRPVPSLFLLECCLAAAGPSNTLYAQPVSDQRESEPPGQFRISFMSGVPQGEFGFNADRGYGAQLDYGGWIGDAYPRMFGVDLSVFTYGRTTNRVPFRSRFPFEVERTNSVASLHLFLRLQEPKGEFRPYAEVLGGFKYLYSRTEVKTLNRGYSRRNNISGTLNYDSFALSGGVGGGADIQVVGPSPDDDLVRTVNIHLGVQYLLGTEAEYLEEGSLEDDNGNGCLDQDELRIRRSNTNVMQVKIGVSFRVGRF